MPDQADLVRELYFGRDDAERDMADGLLRSGFLPTRAYEDALTGRKSLVIGRKGAGKSAICMQLATQANLNSGIALITPDDAAGEELRRFELQGLPLQAAKSLIWRYVFAVQAARYLVEHAKKVHGKKPPSVRAVDRFLQENRSWS
jgi:MoxR-like ATPase